jgi:hypothetical protein
MHRASVILGIQSNLKAPLLPTCLQNPVLVKLWLEPQLHCLRRHRHSNRRLLNAEKIMFATDEGGRVVLSSQKQVCAAGRKRIALAIYCLLHSACSCDIAVIRPC